MVPSLRRDGRISFYVGRDYIGDKPAKYMNPPKELGAASEDVWNLDMIESDSVIICEGVFTAIAASPFKLNAVATYGKSISKVSSNDSGTIVTSQGEKLLNKKFKNYYIAYDADAHKEAIQSCDYLYDTRIEYVSDAVADIAIYIRSQLTHNEPILLVVDSIAAMDCSDNIDSKMVDGKSEMGGRAKALYKYFRIRTELFVKLGITQIYINQLRTALNVGFGKDNTTTTGGAALKFWASIRVAFYVFFHFQFLLLI